MLQSVLCIALCNAWTVLPLGSTFLWFILKGNMVLKHLMRSSQTQFEPWMKLVASTNSKNQTRCTLVQFVWEPFGLNLNQPPAMVCTITPSHLLLHLITRSSVTIMKDFDSFLLPKKIQNQTDFLPPQNHLHPHVFKGGLKDLMSSK